MSMIAKRYTAHTYIYAFESVLSNYQQLAKLDENRFTTTKLFQAGLSDTNRQAMINLASDSMWHSVENNATWEGLGGKSEVINLWTLDDVFETMTLTANVILKIDIEGHELAFLRGAESFLRNQKADFIIIEIGFNPEDKQHTYFPVVCDNLMDKGYRCIDLIDICSYKQPDWGAPSRLDMRMPYSAAIHSKQLAKSYLTRVSLGHQQNDLTCVISYKVAAHKYGSFASSEMIKIAESIVQLVLE